MLDEQSFFILKTAVPCYRGQQLRNNILVKLLLALVAGHSFLRYIELSASSRKWPGLPKPLPLGEVSPQVTERVCNQTVAFFTLFSKIKGKLKNVLLKKWRICVTLHPSCNGIFGDSGVFSPVFYGSGGRRQSDYYAFFLLFCPFWLFSGRLALWQGGKYGKMV